MHTELCDRFGITYPIFVFTPSEKVAAAVSKAGGLGVLGCVRFNDPDDLEAVLGWMDENTDGKPYGVDVVMPAKIPTEGTAADIDKLIPQSHRDFVDKTLADLGVPPLPDDEERSAGVLGWLHSVARSHVEVALRASDQTDRQRARLPAEGCHRPGARGRCPGRRAGGQCQACAAPRRQRRRHRGRAGARGRRPHRRDRLDGAVAGNR